MKLDSNWRRRRTIFVFFSWLFLTEWRIAPDNLIYVAAMEMQKLHKNDNGTNEYFQINLGPIDQPIKELKDSFKDLPPRPS